jgi:ParB family chromosome partitioning protein
MSEEQIQDVAISDIDLVPQLRRSPPDEEQLVGMMQSIVTGGLICPVRVIRVGDRYLILDGFHRVLCFRKLGRKTIPAIIESRELPEGERVLKALIANTQRVENSDVEQAEGLQQVMGHTGWNASTLAEKLGFSNAKVSKLLKILTLPEAIREQVHRGEIPLSSAYELSKVDDGEAQASLASQVASGRLTRDALAGTVRSRKSAQPASQGGVGRVCCKLPSATVTVSAESLDLEELTTALEEVLARARKARSQGLEVSTLAKIFRDLARA